MGLNLNGVYALLDRACRGDYAPLPPASREGLLLFFAKQWSNCRDPRALLGYYRDKTQTALSASRDEGNTVGLAEKGTVELGLCRLHGK